MDGYDENVIGGSANHRLSGLSLSYPKAAFSVLDVFNNCLIHWVNPNQIMGAHRHIGGQQWYSLAKVGLLLITEMLLGSKFLCLTYKTMYGQIGDLRAFEGIKGNIYFDSPPTPKEPFAQLSFRFVYNTDCSANYGVGQIRGKTFNAHRSHKDIFQVIKK